MRHPINTKKQEALESWLTPQSDQRTRFIYPRFCKFGYAIELFAIMQNSFIEGYSLKFPENFQENISGRIFFKELQLQLCRTQSQFFY